MLSVEKERDITIKMIEVLIVYRHPTMVRDVQVILLNIVAYPRYAEFGSKVTQSLVSVQGSIPLFNTA